MSAAIPDTRLKVLAGLRLLHERSKRSAAAMDTNTIALASACSLCQENHTQNTFLDLREELVRRSYQKQQETTTLPPKGLITPKLEREIHLVRVLLFSMLLHSHYTYATS